MADLTRLASPSRCVWVEVSVSGSKSACSWTQCHTLRGVWSWAGETALWLLFVIRCFLDQVRKQGVTCFCCWMFPQVGGRGEELREKAVEQDWSSNSGRDWKASRRAPWVRTIPPGLHQPSQQTWYRWSGSKSSPPACEVFAHIQVSYLGRVDEVQEQLVWGSAKVYLEMPLCVPPPSH